MHFAGINAFGVECNNSRNKCIHLQKNAKTFLFEFMKVYPYFYDLFGGLFFMEIMQVVGKRPIKFKGNDGMEISGTNLYVIYDDNYTEGKKTDKLFVSDHLRSNINYFPKVGDEICVDFNRWGKISNITQMP